MSKETKIVMDAEKDITSPEYYSKFQYQPITAMRERMNFEQFEGYLWGNALKYLMRYGCKDTKLSNVTKAVTYLTWLAEWLKYGGKYNGKNGCDESDKEKMS